MGIKHADRISEALRQRREELRETPRTPRPMTTRSVLGRFLRRAPGPAVLRQEPRARPGGRARRDHLDRRVRQGSRHGPACSTGSAPCNKTAASALNVAVTRAKNRITGSSPRSPQPISTQTSSTRTAPSHTRRYLAYAESNGTSLGPLDDLPPELNPFEIQVRDALTKAGIATTPQHGVSGYRIDFAVKHPEQPGQDPPSRSNATARSPPLLTDCTRTRPAPTAAAGTPWLAVSPHLVI